jgi:hypothetical protein
MQIENAFTKSLRKIEDSMDLDSVLWYQWENWRLFLLICFDWMNNLFACGKHRFLISHSFLFAVLE